MPTIDELVSAYHTLTQSEQKSFLRKVSPRGRVAVSRDLAYRQTWGYLTQSSTIGGEPYDEWVMNSTLEDLEAVRQHPTPEELYELEDKLKKREKKEWLTEEDLDRVAAGPPKHTLSLLVWLWTTQGWAVYKRDGREKFFEWATLQTDKLIKFKTLEMGGLSREVRQRLGREKDQKCSPKGDLLKAVQDAKDDFLMTWCFTWKQIPGALRHKHQRRFRGDADTFYRLQHNYINGIEITQPRQPKFRINRHPSCLRFIYISK